LTNLSAERVFDEPFSGKSRKTSSSKFCSPDFLQTIDDLPYTGQMPHPPNLEAPLWSEHYNLEVLTSMPLFELEGFGELVILRVLRARKP
jgi:hypothetical protein